MRDFPYKFGSRNRREVKRGKNSPYLFFFLNDLNRVFPDFLAVVVCC